MDNKTVNSFIDEYQKIINRLDQDKAHPKIIDTMEYIMRQGLILLGCYFQFLAERERNGSLPRES
jgi:hypothetical protein